MSDVPEKKAAGFVDTMKRKLKGDDKEEEKKEEKKVVKADVPAKPLEEPPPVKMEDVASPSTAKMVEKGAVTLEEANPEMHRKHVTVLNQKKPGARKYFRNRK